MTGEGEREERKRRNEGMKGRLEQKEEYTGGQQQGIRYQLCERNTPPPKKNQTNPIELDGLAQVKH